MQSDSMKAINELAKIVILSVWFFVKKKAETKTVWRMDVDGCANFFEVWISNKVN